MNNYAHILQQALTEPWAIMPEKLAVIQAILKERTAGIKLEHSEIEARLDTQAASKSRSHSAGGVAVLPLVGTIIPRASLLAETSGAISVQRFTAAFREAMQDPEISHIVIDVDSPGGQVGGVPELAAEMRAARDQKPITAVANGLAASAAYWIASAANELVVTPSGDVGSIGVLTMHEDWSEYLKAKGVEVNYIHAGDYKVEGNPYEPLGEDARAEIQRRIDDFYSMFVGDVAANRNVNTADVLAHYGQGRTLGAEAALVAGMVDRIATIDEVVAGALKRGNKSKGKRQRYYGLLSSKTF